MENQLKEIQPKLNEMQHQYSQVENHVLQLKQTVEHVEDEIYADFCRRIRVKNIREYEKFQGSMLQQAAQKRLELATQRSRVENQ